MLVFHNTDYMALVNRVTGECILFEDKMRLSEYFGVKQDTVASWFRPLKGIKPNRKLYNGFEVTEIRGIYKNK